MDARFSIAMLGMFIVGALYAAINVSPNKYRKREPLISSPVLGLLITSLSACTGVTVFALFFINLGKGIVGAVCLLSGYFISRYVIKNPERKYLKEQQN